ncbi:MAG: phosphoribosylglycinamide formyltransferase [Parerythrobacter sp.]
MTFRVAILVSGGGSNMAALAASMTGAHPARTVMVVSSDPSAGALDRARGLGLPSVAVDRTAFRGRAEFEAALTRVLDPAAPDLVCLAGFMHVLSPAFVAAHAGRIVNIHPSLLPSYPGLDAHARALAAGEIEAGCTVHEVTADLDAGPILGQSRVPVLPTDDAGSLAARVLKAEHRLYPEVVRRIASGDRTRQDI